MVVVDEDVNMRPRLTAFVAKAHMNLRVLPRELGEQLAHILRDQAEFRLRQRHRDAAKRPQRRRNGDSNFGNRDLH